jgi:hypothetical protein
MHSFGRNTVGRYVGMWGSQGVWIFNGPADRVHEILLFFCVCVIAEEPGTLKCEELASKRRAYSQRI